MPDELVPQSLEVINLAVVDDNEAAIFGIHRLMSAFDVNNGQTPMSETETRFGMDALSVGTTMTERIFHSVEQSPVGLSSADRIEYADQPAHDFPFSPAVPATLGKVMCGCH